MLKSTTLTQTLNDSSTVVANEWQTNVTSINGIIFNTDGEIAETMLQKELTQFVI
jgi:hypothetical protein